MPITAPDPVKSPYLRTTYAVWELTLKCNLKCIHCGSRAGAKRPDELSTAEAMDLVHQLAEVGIGEVSMIGGEAFLRPDWLDIAREIKACGMRLTMTTGGYGMTPKMAEEMAKAGFTGVSVSVDGLRKEHNLLRGRERSWSWCFKAIEAIRSAGMKCGANTQINRLSAPQLPQIFTLLRDAGVYTWQLQFTVPMGNAADRPELLLQPWELNEVFPLIHYLWLRGVEERPYVYPGNNIGYFGPYERRFRTMEGRDTESHGFWSGSTAGVLTLGIEADGTIKADPSLPTDDYAGGNIRDTSLRELIREADQLTFNDNFDVRDLWGFCRSCEFAEICRGGDTWTAHVFFDRRGNNPYCHHRSLYHAARGERELVQLRTRACGVPFDNGVFGTEVVAEGGAELERGFTLDDVQWPEGWLCADPELPARLAGERERAIEAWRATRLGWSEAG